VEAPAWARMQAWVPSACLRLRAQVLGVGQMGMVLRVKCTRAGHPFPNKDYALKVVFNFGATTYSAVRNLYTAEYETVSSLPRHRNITPYWAQFRDSIPASVRPWDTVVGAFPVCACLSLDMHTPVCARVHLTVTCLLIGVPDH